MPRFCDMPPAAVPTPGEQAGSPDTMRSRLRRSALSREEASAIGAHLAELHRSAPRAESADYERLVDRNFEAMFPLADGLMPPLQWLALRRFSSAFLISWATVLEARAAAGGVILSPCDLRPEHVLIEDGTVRLASPPIDGPRRVIDVADDLGGLLMELMMLTGTREVGDAVLVGYHDADGGTQPQVLVAFFGAFRAQVRMKEALAASASGRSSAAADRSSALAWLTLSRRLNWAARGEQGLRIAGPPHSGKTALVQALERDAGASIATPETLPATSALRDHPAGSALIVEWHGSAHACVDPLRLLVDSHVSTDRQVDAIESWLDSLLAADRTP